MAPKHARTRDSLSRAIKLGAVVLVLAFLGLWVPASAGALSPTTGKGAAFCARVTSAGYPLGASLAGVWACGPLPGASFPSYGDHFQPEGGFQCTELANRFLWVHWHIAPIFGSTLDGTNFAATLSRDRSVRLVANGTPGQPYVPGDIVSFRGIAGREPTGHVAVVVASTENAKGNGTVTIMEENAPATLAPRGEQTMTVSNWVLTATRRSYVAPKNFDALGSPPATRPLAIVTTSLPAGVLRTPYSATLHAIGGTSPYSWSLASGKLPPGLILRTAGSLSGTPTEAGTRTFTVRVTDRRGVSVTRTLRLAVTSPSGTMKPFTAYQSSGPQGFWTWATSPSPCPQPASGETMYGVAVASANTGTVTWTIMDPDTEDPNIISIGSGNLGPGTYSVAITCREGPPGQSTPSQLPHIVATYPPLMLTVTSGYLPVSATPPSVASGQTVTLTGTYPVGDGTGIATACLAGGQGNIPKQVCSPAVHLAAGGHVAAQVTVPTGTAAGSYGFGISIEYDSSTGFPPERWGLASSQAYVNVTN